MARNKPDRLPIESSKALAAGMSYGRWKAMQAPVEVKPSQRGVVKRGACEHCGKEFVQYDNRRRKYCCTDCKNQAFYKVKYARMKQVTDKDGGASDAN